MEIGTGTGDSASGSKSNFQNVEVEASAIVDKDNDDNDDNFSWISIDSSDDSDSETTARKLIDPKSSSFNPKLALYCKNPHPEARDPSGSKFITAKYRSVQEFIKCVPVFTEPPIPSSQRKTKLGSKSASSAPSTSSGISKDTDKPSVLPGSANEPFYPIPGRRFLAHQLPVHRPRKQRPNVITLMDTLGGPFDGLNSARIAKTKVKVWTRSLNGIRGFCTGIVEAFDKHWNLVLSDVYEVFQRKRAIKFPYPATQETNVKVEVEESCSGITTRSKHRQSGGTSHISPLKTKPPRIRNGIKTTTLLDGDNFFEICRIGLENLKLSNSPKKSSNVQSNVPPRNVLETDIQKISNSQLRKKRLVFLNKPEIDSQNNRIIARSKNYEIIERYVPGLFLLGNEVVFIETMINENVVAKGKKCKLKSPKKSSA